MTSSRPAVKPAGRRILVRGVNWLGDAVITTPALQRLREALPDSHITLLTHQKLSSLWQDHPSLDAIITSSPGESPWSVAGRLRAERFETALVLPNSPRSALEVWLARIPRRIGFAHSWRNWFLTNPVAARLDHERMHKRSVSEINRLVRSPATDSNGPLRTTHHAPRTTSTITSIWQRLSARILNLSRRSWKSPPRKFAGQRILSFRTRAPRRRASLPASP